MLSPQTRWFGVSRWCEYVSGYNNATPMADEKSTPSWWQTVPGIMTGLAAIITAITGLILALNHTSARSDAAPVVSSSPSPSSSPLTASTTSSSGVSPAASRSSGAIALPELHEVKFADGSATVTVLSVNVEPIDVDRRSVKFHLRYTNTGDRAANFQNRLFRLIVDDLPRAPTMGNELNELVPSGSTKDGDVRFDVPNGLKDLVFQITDFYGEKMRLQFKLP